ncbi:cytochrome c biogenesis protein ResB [uncultured Jatrophihabitans sp.]|uniref:cytochrome c biogenesis protein ResB n=1 Tax=uncultured Jatrophihabitans sp. TaxID=1610747 RepID=UPI0035CAB5E8
MSESLTAALARPVRTVWRRLTSMRTALILLFLLAVAAVPGSLLPQRPLNPDKTNSYIAAHGSWGRFLDAVGLFDVFGSVWFAAIYLLLFISLIGCLVPRIRVHARAVARKPLPAPRNLDRLPESARFEVADEPVDYAGAARAVLGRRWRVERRDEPSGAVTLSAEKGYSRETGNLIFHVALLVALVLIAVGRLYTYQGSVIVKQGSGFCNVASQFDSWNPGRFAAEGKVSPAPFCIDKLTKFTATYTKSGEPSEFRADVVYRPDVRAKDRRTSITVNHPLRLEGDRVYLINHGFAPSITVRMPDGSVRHDTQTFIPSNPSTFFSEGAYKEQGPATGTPQDIGISAFFAPSPAFDASGRIVSASPRVDKPLLGVTVYEGDLTGNGEQQSVYSLDTSKMKQLGSAKLGIGDTKTLPNGVRVTFDGWRPTATLQVSHDPAQAYLLIAALAMVLGLIGSLGVRRRRLWLRIRPAAVTDPTDADEGESLTVVSVGGLARSDSGNFTTEFANLVERLGNAGTSVRNTDRTSRQLALEPAGGKD